MYIKEIIIDGFKSYANKTSILGLDKHFNAITGLNGSGKSNIFDALCFLMGISSLSNVRAVSLQDLIYKKGLAGVDKASVTVIFDNTNKDGSPVGYEEYDEITVCRMIYQGKSKYMLNGYSSQQDKIRDLFMSVQLNINNPHFLVMQGKVRQVVNMKPIEILGLMEEAAGTSSFQLKKESSLKMIKKKENKLEEINKILAEEITPKIEQIERDKQNYQKWKTTQNEISRLDKIQKAYDFYTCSMNEETKMNELSQYKSQRDEMQGDYNKKLKEMEEIDKKYKELIDKKKNKYEKDLGDLEKQKGEFTSELNIQNHKIDMINKNIKDGEKEIEKLKKKNNDKKIEFGNMQKKKTDLENNAKMYEEEQKNLKEYLNQFEINITNVKAGKNDTTFISNAKLISEYENGRKNAVIEKDQLFEQIKILTNDSKDRKVKLNELNIKLIDSQQKYEHYQEQINETTKKLEQLGIKESNNNMFDAVQKNINNKQAELAKYENQQNNILAKCNQRIEVVYSDPEPNFDRKKIFGTVVKNFRVKDPKYIRALEKAAGTKLYNIIVDNHRTGAALFQKKCFRNYVTLLPLDKIYSKTIPQDKLNMAKACGECVLALDLIEYDPIIEPAMKFVFGNIMVCATQEIAQKVAFGSTRLKSVNLEGDIYDPSGVLTGGVNFFGEPVLLQVAELNEVQAKIENINEEIKELKDKLMLMGENQRKINEQQKKLDELKRKAKEYDRESINKQIVLYENEIKKYSEDIKIKENRIEYLEKIGKKFSEDLAKLKKEEQELKNSSLTGSKKEQLYQKKIEEIKNQINQQKKNIDKTNKDINDLDYKIQNTGGEITRIEEDIGTEQDAIIQSKKELIVAENKVKNFEEYIKKTEVEIYHKQAESMKDEKEINDIQNKKERLEKESNSYKDNLKQLEEKIKLSEETINDSEGKIQKLKKDNEWIESEKNFFGMKGTDYDFSTMNIKEQNKKLLKLQEENNSLKRKVNMKVETMADQYDKEYSELIKKKEIIIKDKNNIQKAIIELDKKRKEALEKVFTHTTESLNKIYKTLLPGTMAKLEQIDKNDLMKGVQLRVAFNGVWKKSLNELSGGQSSLLALSLILALLRFKPAPIYIFDEIDAALDLSHTSNLGIMLKHEFPESQFIVVSLKDGMFSNANVLYRVSYVDGSSKVERLTKSNL